MHTRIIKDSSAALVSLFVLFFLSPCLPSVYPAPAPALLLSVGGKKRHQAFYRNCIPTLNF